ncbi:ABC transporter substrate-binding protein [Magnetofaba australis]|uniref:Putative ABC transporter substrate-binding protein-like protein n=1 Tax=Magnetofaba australis IT-1 TaxID=1434232 RepID=A0A1Y2K8R4_9PROT|nr:ABC transporter substrate binding protein [Magnetofaba australis]OSM07128.1 putative ABC transporter substrate-binding protein-like protein [Magnetofaba australis IT-1]
MFLRAQADGNATWRSVLLCCVAALMALVGATRALAVPESGRQYRLLIVDSQLGMPYDEIRAALLTTLGDAGYRLGINLNIDLHAIGNDAQQGEALLRKSLDRPYDVVYVGGTAAAIAAQRALAGAARPVVFGAPTDPVGLGLIKTFDAPPTGNFTGVSYPVPPRARLRFVRQLLPKARTFGLVYADMPQSHSYNRWIRKLLATDPEFRDIRVIFRSVPLITGEHGDEEMARLAAPIIEELTEQVDLFLKPNDQMGVRRHLAETLAKLSTKPVIGIVKNDVMDRWGATAVIYPSHESIGQQAAQMIQRLFEGASVADITPQWPKRYGYAVDLNGIRRHHLTAPVGLLQLAGANIIK